MRVYSGGGSSLLNMTVKFFLTNYLLYDFLLRAGGEVPTLSHKRHDFQKRVLYIKGVF